MPLAPNAEHRAPLPDSCPAARYVLPYPAGDAHEVWRTTEHDVVGNGHVGRWAIDFRMLIGSPIVAARAGVVVATRDSFPDDNGEDLHENFVFVRHADGTVARYLHLTRGGALVGVGDTVRQGQRIARSGNSGQSAGPHLHFDVQTCGPNLPPSYNALPCGRTVPVAFTNAWPPACTLEAAHTYRAMDASGTGWSLDTLHLDVRVAPDAARGRRLVVAGRATLRAPATGSTGPTLVVAPGAIAFDTIDVDGATVTYSPARDSAHVRLTVPAQAGAPLVARFRVAPRDDRVGRGVAVGAEGAFASWGANWYPWPAAAADADPDLAAPGTLRLSIPVAWHALSNGRLVDSTTVGAERVERWASDRAVAWSMTAAAYVVERRRVGTTDVAAYVMPRQRARIAAFAAAIPPMVAVLARAYGPYPFATFAIAAMPASIAPPGIVGRSEQGWFFAHEHALDGDSVPVALFAHELAHMWWPNLVDSRPPGDDMMDEGLASQGAALVVAARDGRAAARQWLHDGEPAWSARGYFHLWRIGADRPLMADYDPLTPRAKGPLVYEMIRDRLGDSVYFGVLRALAHDRAGGSASLADLRAALLRAAPNDHGLPRLLADWLDRGGAPVLDVAWRGAGAGRVRVRITQRTTPYALPLDVAVDGTGGTRTTRVALTDSVQTFDLPTAGRVTAVRLDPSHRLLLWEPAFGPVRGVTPAWSADRERAWLGAEVDWLARSYGARAVGVTVADGGAVVWRRGATPPPLGTAPAADTTVADVAARGTTVAVWRAARRAACVVRSDLPTLGVTLAEQVCQRVAVLWRWPTIPGRP
ncbi:Peptidase M23 (plasmid) [Gemmatirosa kalamazoonensis]|uniref:Peptidase M23 n=1 Tax=Gemmatirosa kalamazoonensis TaxID=861299 RepID=W0RTK0_9BACT|nr:peptidoglycan DD-metalloendopeptidase family protein [Gemmatirosa kalamazoonensis]AHG93640.1 Peptidase M23 [Gemmatirosa kalamazoonensis]